MAILSIMGMYNYDPSIFDLADFPQGIKKETVVNEICLQCAELEIIYPEPKTLRNAIGLWSEIEGPIWEKLYNTEKLEYNPLWNVDAYISETGKGNRSDSGKNTNVNSVVGYNSTNWNNAEKDQNDAQSAGKWDDERITRRTGNIGVTSSQELLEREREVSDFSTIKFIIDSFKKRFCLMIY